MRLGKFETGKALSHTLEVGEREGSHDTFTSRCISKGARGPIESPKEDSFYANSGLVEEQNAILLSSTSIHYTVCDISA